VWLPIGGRRRVDLAASGEASDGSPEAAHVAFDRAGTYSVEFLTDLGVGQVLKDQETDHA
jgi:hypothetical protein